MNHDDKTVELELPGFTPKKAHTAPTKAQATSHAAVIPERVHPEALSFSANELPWILRLVAAIAILALSVWLL